MLDGLIDLLKQFFEWFIHWLYDLLSLFLNTLLTPIAEALPDLSAEVGFIYQYGSFANEWLDLEFGLNLLGIWFLVVGIVIGVKWVLGLIPTIS